MKTRNFNTELIELQRIRNIYVKWAIEKLKIQGKFRGSTKINNVAKLITGYYLTKKDSLDAIKKYCDGVEIDLDAIKKIALKPPLPPPQNKSLKKKKNKNSGGSSKEDQRFAPLKNIVYDPEYTREKALEFYKSPEWRSLRVLVIQEQKGECQMCGRSHRRHRVVIHVDHIIPLSINWSRRLDKTNLQLLCEDCNLGKVNHYTTDWRKI